MLGGIECVREKNFTQGGVGRRRRGWTASRTPPVEADPFEDRREKYIKKKKQQKKKQIKAGDQLGRSLSREQMGQEVESDS